MDVCRAVVLPVARRDAGRPCAGPHPTLLLVAVAGGLGAEPQAAHPPAPVQASFPATTVLSGWELRTDEAASWRCCPCAAMAERACAPWANVIDWLLIDPCLLTADRHLTVLVLQPGHTVHPCPPPLLQGADRLPAVRAGRHAGARGRHPGAGALPARRPRRPHLAVGGGGGAGGSGGVQIVMRRQAAGTRSGGGGGAGGSGGVQIVMGRQAAGTRSGGGGGAGGSGGVQIVMGRQAAGTRSGEGGGAGGSGGVQIVMGRQAAGTRSGGGGGAGGSGGVQIVMRRQAAGTRSGGGGGAGGWGGLRCPLSAIVTLRPEVSAKRWRGSGSRTERSF